MGGAPSTAPTLTEAILTLGQASPSRSLSGPSLCPCLRWADLGSSDLEVPGRQWSAPCLLPSLLCGAL